MKNRYDTIDEYIEAFPDNIRAVLKDIRHTVHTAAPGATEAIAYQMPTFRLHGNLVHFAAFKNHIGFFPTPSGIEAFKQEIAQYKWAKGSVQFPLAKPIPYDLIARIVKYRVEESKLLKKGKRTVTRP